MRAYLVTPGFEGPLSAELAPVFPTPRTLVPGVVATEDVTDEAARALDPVFSRQVLPHATEVSGAAVSALAEGAYAAIEASVDKWPGPFTLHAFGPPVPADAEAPDALPGARGAHSRALVARRGGGEDTPPARSSGPSDGGLGRRATLVGQALLALIAQRRRRASRRFVEDVPVDAFDDELMVIQILALGRERIVVSAAAPGVLPRGGYELARWPAGAAPVTDDREPPSRAYKKLEEAFQWMGRAPRAGQACVDLGAAPGSWTLTASRHGARVLAVDRAALAPIVAKRPGVTTIGGDAFTYAPATPVDWLLSDIICEPQRAISLVESWLDKRCRNLVVTIKFKGRDHYGALAALTPIFDHVKPAYARVKHLAHNKNEVTVMASMR